MAEDIDTKQQEAQSDTSAGTGAGAGNDQQAATSAASTGRASEGQSRSAGPVGSGNYEVQQGDCISSIAYEHGFFGDTLWGHSANAELKRVRKNPNVLLPGDRLTIPELRLKKECGATEERHRFRRRGVPEYLQIRLLDEKDKPRKDLVYKINVDGQVRAGRTNADGILKEPIFPNAREGLLIIGEGAGAEKYPLSIGHLVPITTVQGVQKRLNNLGLRCGAEDGILNEGTRKAIELFQQRHGLTVTGKPDQATQNKLVEVHGG